MRSTNLDKTAQKKIALRRTSQIAMRSELPASLVLLQNALNAVSIVFSFCFELISLLPPCSYYAADHITDTSQTDTMESKAADSVNRLRDNCDTIAIPFRYSRDGKKTRRALV